MQETKSRISDPFLKVFICCLVITLSFFAGFAQTEAISASISKQSFIYSVKDSSELGLDVYTLKTADSNTRRPCILFVFGGAFIAGQRDDTLYNRYFNSLVSQNYIVVSISYRLGMRGVKNVSKFNTRPLVNAINMAVEDVYDATGWVIAHAGSLGIDTSKIILSGSSSGAITILQSEYHLINGNPMAKNLPLNFKYAGTISFSGAVLSFDWGLKYKDKPAPALMFHGTADRIVPYRKIGFLNKGFYGSAWIAKVFKEKNYPYYLYSEQGLGHEVSVYPMYENLPLILDFIDKYIIQQRPLQIDFNINDPDVKPMMLLTPEELLKKLQQK